MGDNDPFKGYKVRWVQAYKLDGQLTMKDLEMIARKLIAEFEEDQMLEDSGYAEAKEVINYIKSL